MRNPMITVIFATLNIRLKTWCSFAKKKKKKKKRTLHYLQCTGEAKLDASFPDAEFHTER